MPEILAALSGFIEQYGVATLVLALFAYSLFSQSQTKNKIETARIEMERESERRSAEISDTLHKVMETRLVEKQQSIENLQARFDRQQSENLEEINLLKRDAKDNRDKIAKLNREIEKLQSDLEQENQRRTVAEERATKLENRQNELENMNTRLNMDNNHMTQSNLRLQNRIVELQADIDKLRFENNKLAQQLAEALNEIDALRNGQVQPAKITGEIKAAILEAAKEKPHINGAAEITSEADKGTA